MKGDGPNGIGNTPKTPTLPSRAPKASPDKKVSAQKQPFQKDRKDSDEKTVKTTDKSLYGGSTIYQNLLTAYETNLDAESKVFIQKTKKPLILANFEDSPCKEEYENTNREEDKNEQDLRGLGPK